jgi:hypothetical protein
MFLDTSFNFLDNTLVKLFKNGNNLTESVRKISDNILYVSSDFLNGKDENDNIINGNITSISLTTWLTTVGSENTGYGKVKFYKKEGDTYKIITNVKLKEILDNGVLDTVVALNPYTDTNISIDCTGGAFPKTVKTINTFYCNSPSFNYTEFEQIFNGLTDCNVWLDRFFGAQTKTSVTKPINIYNLLFKSDGTPKINFKLRLKSTYVERENFTITDRTGDINFGLNFDKTCTADQFKTIM